MAAGSISFIHMGDRRSKLTKADVEAARRLGALWDARAGRLGLTQEKMADRMDITQGAVSHYLRGRMALNYIAVMAFAKALDCDPSDIRSDLPEQALAQRPARHIDVDPAVHDDLREMAIDMVIASLVRAACLNVPNIAPVLASHLEATAGSLKPHPLRTDKGILGIVLEICRAIPAVSAEGAPPSRRRGSAR